MENKNTQHPYDVKKVLKNLYSKTGDNKYKFLFAAINAADNSECQFIDPSRVIDAMIKAENYQKNDLVITKQAKDDEMPLGM